MKESDAVFIFDPHLHFYPVFNPITALGNLKNNLIQGASTPSGCNALPRVYMGLIAERAGDPPVDASLGSILISHDSVPSASSIRKIICSPTRIDVDFADSTNLYLLKGQQHKTKENLEILTFPATRINPPDWAVVPLVQFLIQEGLHPIIPWAPGKWLFNRGKIIQLLIDRFSPHLTFCDASIRPRNCALPPLMQEGLMRGNRVWFGSDPLPMSGEEIQLGIYASQTMGRFDPTNVESSFNSIFQKAPGDFSCVGHRNPWWMSITRMIRYQISRRAR